MSPSAPYLLGIAFGLGVVAMITLMVMLFSCYRLGRSALERYQDWRNLRTFVPNHSRLARLSQPFPRYLLSTCFIIRFTYVEICYSAASLSGPEPRARSRLKTPWNV